MQCKEIEATTRKDIQGIRMETPSEKQTEPGQQLTGPRPEAGRPRAADREIYRGSKKDRTKEPTNLTPPESTALCSEESGQPCRWLHGTNVVSSGSRTPGLLDRQLRLCELRPVASMEGQSQEARECVPQRVRDRPCGLIHLSSVGEHKHQGEQLLEASGRATARTRGSGGCLGQAGSVPTLHSLWAAHSTLVPNNTNRERQRDSLPEVKSGDAGPGSQPRRSRS